MDQGWCNQKPTTKWWGYAIVVLIFALIIIVYLAFIHAEKRVYPDTALLYTLPLFGKNNKGKTSTGTPTTTSLTITTSTIPTNSIGLSKVPTNSILGTTNLSANQELAALRNSIVNPLLSTNTISL